MYDECGGLYLQEGSLLGVWSHIQGTPVPKIRQNKLQLEGRESVPDRTNSTRFLQKTDNLTIPSPLFSVLNVL